MSQVEENIEMRSLFQALVLPAAICAAGVTLFWSLPAKADPVDCARAELSAEFAICNNETLQILDEQLGNRVKAVLVNSATLPQRQANSREHNAWLGKRNACGADFACLELRYRERLNTLDGRKS